MVGKYSQPALLWALVLPYAAKKWPPREDFKESDLKLIVFPAKKKGGWVMSGPKLYWEDEVGGAFKVKCSQDVLETEDLGEVVLLHKRIKSQVQWSTLGAAIKAMMVLQGTKKGAPLKYEEVLTVRADLFITKTMGEALPTGRARSEFIRAAIQEKLDRNKTE